MANGYMHKIFSIPELFDFSVSYNNEAFDLEKVLTPHFFAGTGICIKPNGQANSLKEIEEREEIALMCKISQNPEQSLEIRMTQLGGKTNIEIAGPILENEERVKAGRAQGTDIKGVGSLLSRALRAVAASRGNIFLHANGVYDSEHGIFFIIASDKDAAGKSAIVNEFLRESRACKLFSNSLRLKIDGDKYSAYSQSFGAPENKFYAFVRKTEEELLEAKGGKLSDFGFEKLSALNEPVGSNYSLLAVPCPAQKLDISGDVRICCIFPEGVSSKQDKPLTYELRKDEGARRMLASWQSYFKLDQPIYGVLNCEEFNAAISRIAETARPKVEDFASRANYFYVRQASPFNIWHDIMTRMYMKDLRLASELLDIKAYPKEIIGPAIRKIEEITQDPQMF